MNKRKLIIVSAVLLCSFIITIGFILLYKKNNEVFVPIATTSNTPDYTKNPETTVTPEEPKRWPKPTIAPVMKSMGNADAEAALPVSIKPKRYLQVNPIKINEAKRTIDSDTIGNDNIKAEFKFPQIDGLTDLTVQNKINKDIQGYADRLAENTSLYKKDLIEVRLNYNVTANYNNVLCINIYATVRLTDDTFSINEVLLYELVNGNKLELKDIFRKELSFPGVLNRAIDEYFLRRNLEEDMLIAPFKGIRENQNYILNENKLIISYNGNEEIRPGMSMMFRMASIEFKLNEYSNIIDIYDKYSDPAKQIYTNKVTKRKMLPNSLTTLNREVDTVRDTYSGVVSKLVFSDLENRDFQKRINEICSYSREEEFKKLLPDNLEKKAELNKMPRFMTGYVLAGNYGDVINIRRYTHFNISDDLQKDEVKHFSYNIITGKELELKEVFKKDYDYKKAIFNYINTLPAERKINLTEADLYSLLLKSDFWFDDIYLFIDLNTADSPQDQHKVISIPFEYLGEENCTIRE